MPEAHSYPVGVYDSTAVTSSSSHSVAARSQFTSKKAIPMDAGETEQQKKIQELQAIIAKGLKGINECRYKTDCEFACTCPGIC